jgi:hypothetical protein
MEEVVICRTGENDKRLEFRVSVIDNTDRTIPDVCLSHQDYEIFGLRSGSPERFVEQCLEFLLERLAKESIRSEFDIGTMAEYFPDFAQEMRGGMMHHLRPAGRGRWGNSLSSTGTMGEGVVYRHARHFPWFQVRAAVQGKVGIGHPRQGAAVT